MINLRYHIVSLTAVFLAMGIGLTLGSTFLDRATVDNLNGQLEGLAHDLRDRNEEIDGLRDDLGVAEETQRLLDEQGLGLLGGRLAEVDVVLIAARGVDEASVDSAVRALTSAGASVDGVWWLTDRLVLEADSDVTDLATLLGEESRDPARLRRTLVSALGGELRSRQIQATADPAAAPTGTTPDATTPPDTTPTTVAPPADTTPVTQPPPPGGQIDLVDQLVAGGFVDFAASPSGPSAPRFPAGAHVVLVGGSTEIPDDLVVVPLLQRLTRATTTPMRGIVTSASGDGGEISDAVSIVREDETLRTLVSTVDNLNHMQDWAALVLALADVDRGLVGHYGLAEGAGRLLPAPVPA